MRSGIGIFLHIAACVPEDNRPSIVFDVLRIETTPQRGELREDHTATVLISRDKVACIPTVKKPSVSTAKGFDGRSYLGQMSFCFASRARRLLSGSLAVSYHFCFTRPFFLKADFIFFLGVFWIEGINGFISIRR